VTAGSNRAQINRLQPVTAKQLLQRDDDCQSARHEVLIADSAEPVEFTSTDREMIQGQPVDIEVLETYLSRTGV